MLHVPVRIHLQKHRFKGKIIPNLHMTGAKHETKMVDPSEHGALCNQLHRGRGREASPTSSRPHHDLTTTSQAGNGVARHRRDCCNTDRENDLRAPRPAAELEIKRRWRVPVLPVRLVGRNAVTPGRKSPFLSDCAIWNMSALGL